VKTGVYIIQVDAKEGGLPTIEIKRRTKVGLPDEHVQTLYGDEAKEFFYRYCMTPPEKLDRISEQANKLVKTMQDTNNAVIGLLEAMNAAMKEIDENV
jgi:hypothetical protein